MFFQLEIKDKNESTCTRCMSVVRMAHLSMLCSLASCHSAGRYDTSELAYGRICTPTRSITNDITCNTCIWNIRGTWAEFKSWLNIAKHTHTWNRYQNKMLQLHRLNLTSIKLNKFVLIYLRITLFHLFK